MATSRTHEKTLTGARREAQRIAQETLDANLPFPVIVPGVDPLPAVGETGALYLLTSDSEFYGDNGAEIRRFLTEDDFTELKDMIDDLDSRLDTVEGAVGDLEDRVDDAELDINNLETAVTSQGTDIGDLQADVADLDAEVGALDLRIDELEEFAAPNTITLPISAPDGSIKYLTTDDQLYYWDSNNFLRLLTEDDYADLDARLDSVEGGLSTAEDEINDLQADVAGLQNFQAPTVGVLPAAGTFGRIRALSSDTGLYFDNGTNWIQIA